MPKCPHCHAETLVKAGFNRSGSQRYRCKMCQRYTTLAPKRNGYPLPVHEQALKYYLEGMGLRRIGRFLQVTHQTVANWINAAHACLPTPVPQPISSTVTELDELYTFVREKKTKSMWSRRWIAQRVVWSGMRWCPNVPSRSSKTSLIKVLPPSITSAMGWPHTRMSTIGMRPTPPYWINHRPFRWKGIMRNSGITWRGCIGARDVFPSV